MSCIKDFLLQLRLDNIEGALQMNKITLLWLVSFTLLLGDGDLDVLLGQYESQSSLYHKTKNEGAGHLILFSRHDLDKMQAHSLKDILKSIRFFTLQEGGIGDLNLQRAGASCVNSGCIRAYINNQEMSSAVSGGALETIAEYDLGHVDHVEIYLGGSAMKLGNEYGFVTIKIYTKDPKREQGGDIAASYGSKGSNSLEALHTGMSDNNIEYLLYAKKNHNDKDDITNKGFVIPRYSDTANIYGSIKKENDYMVELSNYEIDRDALAGFGKNKTPEMSNLQASYRHISLTKHLDSVKLQASYAQEKREFYAKDPSGIKLNNGITVNEFGVSFDNTIAKLNLENTHAWDEWEILYGVSFQQKDINLESKTYKGLDALNIYMGYLESQYAINENNLLLGSAKFSQFQHKGTPRRDDLYEARLGFVSLLPKGTSLKTFVSYNYVYPDIKELIVFDQPIGGNPDLKPMKVDNFSAELTHTYENHTISLMYSRRHLGDVIKINAKPAYYTLDVHAQFNDYGLDYTYTFDQNHKLMLEYYFTQHNRPTTESPEAGGYLKLFNTVGKFDIYNELIYREGYYSAAASMSIKDAYDWTASIAYEINKQFSVALKGENLLDKSITSPIKNVYPVKLNDRSVMLYATWSY